MVGKITGDGHLDHSFTAKFIGQKQDTNKLRQIIHKEFRIPLSKFSTYKRNNCWNGISHLLQVNDSIFGRLLFSFGAPAGNKTRLNFRVPEWIVESENDNIKKYYLQALLDDELSVVKIRRENHADSPMLKMTKNKCLIQNLREFLEDIKKLLEHFGIECSKISKPILENSKENGDTFSIYFRIKQKKKNIINFRHRIGFRINKTKIDNLTRCCKILENSIDIIE